MSTTTEIRASLRGADGGNKGDITLPGLFGEKPRDHLVYEVVHMQQASRRAGTHATKTRAFVSGGGAKPCVRGSAPGPGGGARREKPL